MASSDRRRSGGTTMEERRDAGEVLEARLGSARAAALVDELAAAGFVIVETERLARLEREAEGYRRMAALVSEPEA